MFETYKPYKSQKFVCVVLLEAEAWHSAKVAALCSDDHEFYS